MMESTTLSYGGVETIKEVIIISFIMVLSFSLALVYWKYLEKGYVLKCSKLCKMPSYFTVVLKKLPNYYAEDEIKAHL